MCLSREQLYTLHRLDRLIFFLSALDFFVCVCSFERKIYETRPDETKRDRSANVFLLLTYDDGKADSSGLSPFLLRSACA